MRILYLSCHNILEYDEVKLLHELGYEVFSPGSYVEPLNPGDSSLRPGIEGLVYNQDMLEQWHRLASQHPGEDTKDHLTREFVDNFDAVVVMHLPRWIERNWDVMKHKRVIWRTIGQSVASTEDIIRPYRKQGLEIVRYSPMEAGIPGFVGQDALIRFYKDPDEYNGWTGKNLQVITFGQSMKSRDQACNFTFFEQATHRFTRKLFGPGNENAGELSGGKLTYEEQKRELRESRVYFYTGTHPASYTLNFIEALMTGIPLVCIGPRHGNATYFQNHNLYEIPHLLKNQVDGFISDNVIELQNYISLLLRDDTIAKQIGRNGRAAAIHHFGKSMIAAAWKAYLG